MLLLGAIVFDAVISSSPLKDLGAHDKFGHFHEDQAALGGEPMRNVIYSQNKGIMRSKYADRPAPQRLADFSAAWELADETRTFGLILVEMQEGYRREVDFIIPTVQKLLTAFREAGQPVVWTSWHRLAVCQQVSNSQIL